MARGRTLVALAVVAAAVAVAVGDLASPTEAATKYTQEDSSRKTVFKRVVKSKGRRGRIVGGRQLGRLDPDSGSQFIATLNTPSGGMYCGAVLISFNHVLTRAGCYPQVGDKVLVGGVELFGGLEMRVGAVHAHPNYNPDGDLNDIAVLRLWGKTEAEMVNKGIVPVLMRKTLGKPHGFYVTGFGAVDKAARSAGSLSLKRGYQPLSKWWQCRQILRYVTLPNGRPLPINTSSQVCTNYKSFRSGALCERDVGGPMFRTKWSNGRKVYELYAIAAYWVGTEEDRCPQGLPNVGTSVPYFYWWIQQQMRK